MTGQQDGRPGACVSAKQEVAEVGPGIKDGVDSKARKGCGTDGPQTAQPANSSLSYTRERRADHTAREPIQNVTEISRV